MSKYGINGHSNLCHAGSGIFMAQALALCPDLVVMSYNFPLYQQISEQVQYKSTLKLKQK